MSKIIFNRDVEIKGLSVNGKINELNQTSMKFENSTILNTVPKQIKYSSVDETNSKRFIDSNGPTSENIQYLQLDRTTTVPTSNAGTFNNVFYEDASSSYMLGVSTQALYYSTIPGYSADTNNNNRLTKREMFNLMQDVGLIDASSQAVDTSYNTFVSLWGRSIFGTPTFDSWYISQNLTIKLATGAENFWAWGTNMIVWRYDLKNNVLISRSLTSMLREIDPTNSSWKTATGGRGPVTSIGDGKFTVVSTNATYSAILVFSKDLLPLSNINLSSYRLESIQNPKAISETDYATRALYSFGINTDQINNIFVKKWYASDLQGIQYKSLYDGSSVNVFNTDDGLATFIYANSSSQGQYDTVDKSSSFITTGIMTPLSSAKWNNSSGKVIQYALYKDANNNNKLTITPVGIYKTNPDDYLAGDKLKIESFIQCPDKTTKEILNINYPLIDNRAHIVDLSGYETLRSPAWKEGFNQWKFTDGSSNTLPISKGYQKFIVSIADISGVIVKPSDRVVLANRGRCIYYQDVYATPYRRLLDGSDNIYYKQASIANESTDTGLLFTQLSDPSCVFYPGDGTVGALTSRRYRDLTTNKWYYINASGDYTENGTLLGAQDPVVNNFKAVRKQIMNSGFAKRYMFTPYELDSSKKAFSKDLSNNTQNPRLPPFITDDNNRNPGQQLIKADIYFPHDHDFNATQYYYSKPFPLKWEDTREYAAADGISYLYQYSFANASANKNKGTTKDISGEYVQEFFRLCQSGQGDLSANHDVQVLLPQNSYQDLSGVESSTNQNVPEGHIVFKVRGSVLSCQPIQIKFTENMANNITLTDYMAKQLNFYGSGVYNQNCLLKDENNDYHMIVGASNGNYANISESLYPSEYASRKVISEMQKLLSGLTSELPISKDTALFLGFGNMNSNPQEVTDLSRNGTFTTIHGFKTIIRDNSGNVLLDTSLRGISDLNHRTTCYAAKYYADLSQNYVLSNGQNVMLKNDVTNCNFYSYPLKDPLGTQKQLSGSQVVECRDFVVYLHELRGRVTSPRSKRVVNNRSACIDPKTMALEHIITHRFADLEFHHSFPREYLRLTVDAMAVDQGQNRDEMHAVTTGEKYLASAGKTHIKVIDKTKVSGKKATLISIDSSRNNFACSYDGALGRQELGNEKYTFGNDAVWINYTAIASISNQTIYGGKYNGRDLYIHSQTAHLHGEAASNKISFPIVPIIDGVKYNGFEDIRNIVKSDDGKAWILPRRNSEFHQSDLGTSGRVSGLPTSVSATSQTWQIEKTPLFKMTYGFTADDNGKLKLEWVTIVNIYKPWDLFKDDAANGFGGNAASVQGISAVNDLCFVPGYRELFVLNCANGAILQTFHGNDFDYDEVQQPFKTVAEQSVKPDCVGIGSVQYADGKLYIFSGYNRAGVSNILHSRKVFELSLKQNSKQSINLSKLDISGGFGSLVKSNLPNANMDVVFTEQETVSYNNNDFMLITTFSTRDKYAKLIKGYKQIDAQYDALYHSGVTAIAVKTTDKFFKNYSSSSRFSDKFINGGSWYENTGISYADLSANILFLYGGQIPSRSIIQSPFYVNKWQQLEAQKARNQKKLLTEYYRAKSPVASTYPYPDNGWFVGQQFVTIHNNMRFMGYWNNTDNALSTTLTTAYNPNFDRYDSTKGASGKSQLWHQPLEFTDVGGPNGINSRLFNSPVNN